MQHQPCCLQSRGELYTGTVTNRIPPEAVILPFSYTTRRHGFYFSVYGQEQLKSQTGNLILRSETG